MSGVCPPVECFFCLCLLCSHDRLYPVGITVQRYPVKDIILQNYHIPAGVSWSSLYLSIIAALLSTPCHLTIFTCHFPDCRRWCRPASIQWAGALMCLTSRCSSSLAGGPAVRLKGWAFASWHSALARGSVSAGGSPRTRCSCCSCM